MGTILLLCAFGCVGCESQPRAEASGPSVSLEHRQGYALLHSVVSRQQGVSKILILKSPSDETAAIVRAIAKTAAEATDKLEAFAKQRGIELSDPATGLPQIDRDNRARIESRTTKYLLFGSGESFETKLIYTQLNACEYCLTIARQLASTKDIPDEHAAYFKKFADDYESIFNKLVARLALK